MDEDARSIIQKQGRLYTERLLSAAMEAGFDLKAIPVVMLGGGAAVVKGNVAPSGLSAPASISLRETASGLESSTNFQRSDPNSLCRVFALLDDRVNAEGFERIFGQLKTACVSVGRCGQGMNRPLFMFRPNLQNEGPPPGIRSGGNSFLSVTTPIKWR